VRPPGRGARANRGQYEDGSAGRLRIGSGKIRRRAATLRGLTSAVNAKRLSRAYAAAKSAVPKTGARRMGNRRLTLMFGYVEKRFMDRRRKLRTQAILAWPRRDCDMIARRVLAAVDRRRMRDGQRPKANHRFVAIVNQPFAGLSGAGKLLETPTGSAIADAATEPARGNNWRRRNGSRERLLENGDIVFRARLSRRIYRLRVNRVE